MAQDFQKKQPTKSEQMFYEMFMRMQSMDQSLYSNSMQLLALALALDVTPQKMADLLTTDVKKLQEYGKEVNDEIEKRRAQTEAKDANPEELKSEEKV